MNRVRPAIRIPARNGNSNWISFASGPFGNWVLTQPSDGRIRIEAYLDSGDESRNRALFDAFEVEKDIWANRAGVELTFERLDGKRACRIANYHAAVELLTLSRGEREELVQSVTERFLAMYSALDQALRARAKTIREARIVPNTEALDHDIDADYDVAVGVDKV